MYQSDIDHAVALATGESVSEIHHRGFNLTNPFEEVFDPEPDDLPPQSIDWDQLESWSFVI